MKMMKIMKTMKKDPLLLFVILVLLLLSATILSTLFINYSNKDRTQALQIKSLQIEDHAKEISDKISNLDINRELKIDKKCYDEYFKNYIKFIGEIKFQCETIKDLVYSL